MIEFNKLTPHGQDWAIWVWIVILIALGLIW